MRFKIVTIDPKIKAVFFFKKNGNPYGIVLLDLQI